ncbi:MAG: carboxylase, partial [Dehalococcoidia bacterium]|nr:carboxylase [Dehalococcoidia bacterium]
NLVSQLREADALDKLDDVLEEIPRTRADLGFPPLVTPMSQMVGSQSVSNVLFGRYTMISEPVKEYFRGNFGTPPSAVDEDLKAKIIEQDGGNERGTPVRPGAILDPEMDSAREAVNDITSNIDDVLIYALYPQTGLRFLKIKHGIEPVPDEMKPKNDDDQPSTSPSHTLPTDVSASARRFNVYAQGQRFEVVVDPVDGANVITPPSRIPASASPTPPAAASVPSGSLVTGGDVALLSPMPGMLVSIAVEIGQTVSAGETVLKLEAMKMQNSLPAPIAGTVKELPVAPGAQVAKDDVLAIIAP